MVSSFVRACGYPFNTTKYHTFWTSAPSYGSRNRNVIIFIPHFNDKINPCGQCLLFLIVAGAHNGLHVHLSCNHFVIIEPSNIPCDIWSGFLFLVWISDLSKLPKLAWKKCKCAILQGPLNDLQMYIEKCRVNDEWCPEVSKCYLYSYRWKSRACTYWTQPHPTPSHPGAFGNLMWWRSQ